MHASLSVKGEILCHRPMRQGNTDFISLFCKRRVRVFVNHAVAGYYLA